jgi:acetyl-CoA acyltransferase
MGLKIEDVPGMTVNRYCASGIETVSIAVAKIQSGMADCIIAGGVESMSYIPMGGYRPVPNYKAALEGNEDYYWGMGLTAEAVAKQFNVSREDQDLFSFNSHMKALKAQAEGKFNNDIVPITVENIFIDENGKKQTKNYTVSVDEGPRKGTSLEALAKLRPVFALDGTVTAGNSSQMSDGAAFLLVMSEEMVKELNIEPIARMVSFAAVGVEPRIMGIGPVKAIPKALTQANLTLNDIDLIELNEAFASQSLAVMRELNINQEIVNVNGGAIALGHPLGCTGAKLSVQLFNEMRRRKNKYGIVTMCVGTGQGAAGVYELLK